MQNYVTILEQIPLFQSFSNEEILKAVDCLGGTIEFYHKKERLYTSGCIGIILEGIVFLSKDDISGVRFIYSELEEGEVFGEAELHGKQEDWNYEAIAASDCRILWFQVKNIIPTNQVICSIRGKIIENLFIQLLEKNHFLYEKIDIISHKSLRSRILHFLQFEAKKNNSDSFEIPFSRADFADYLKVDRSALSRELGRMEKEGILHFSKNFFQLKTVKKIV